MSLQREHTLVQLVEVRLLLFFGSACGWLVFYFEDWLDRVGRPQHPPHRQQRVCITLQAVDLQPLGEHPFACLVEHLLRLIFGGVEDCHRLPFAFLFLAFDCQGRLFEGRVALGSLLFKTVLQSLMRLLPGIDGVFLS